MPEAAVFIDTVALLAMANRDDALHPAAARAYAGLIAARTPLATTDRVLMEFLGGGAKKPLRALGLRIVGRLHASSRTTVLPASRSGWLDASELFAARSDTEWSLVDCASILVCGSLGIRRLLTSDHHFVQAGFGALLR